MDNYNDYVNNYMNSYNCPDCNDAKLQSDKNARKINEVIEQVNRLIQVNNETVDFIEEVAEEKVEEKINEITFEEISKEKIENVVEEKVNEALGNLDVDIDLSSYVKKTDLSEYVTETDLNRKGYLTQHQDISGKADKSTLTSHTSDTTIHITEAERNT